MLLINIKPVSFYMLWLDKHDYGPSDDKRLLSPSATPAIADVP